MKKFTIALIIATSISLIGCTQGTTSKTATAVKAIPLQAQTIKKNSSDTKQKNTKVAQDTQKVQLTALNNNNIEYLFSKDKQHPDQKLIKIINSSKSKLDIAIYNLSNKGIVHAILQAKKRGVKVRIITDKQEAYGNLENIELRLIKKAGIPIKVNTYKGVMHLKITIADKNVVTTGSYDYTQAATTENDEILVVINDKNAAKIFEAQFERMWKDTVSFRTF